MTDHKTVREALESVRNSRISKGFYIDGRSLDVLLEQALAALDRIEAVETVTVEDIAMCIQDWKFNEENQQPFFGDYLAVKFPNGLRIVQSDRKPEQPAAPLNQAYE